METEILKELRERTIKNFLDVLVLAELNNGYPLSGHDFITFIHKRFRILISSGTAHSLLYALERKGLIEGMWNRRKRMYKLSEKGGETINTILNGKEKIQELMTKLL